MEGPSLLSASYRLLGFGELGISVILKSAAAGHRSLGRSDRYAVKSNEPHQQLQPLHIGTGYKVSTQNFQGSAQVVGGLPPEYIKFPPSNFFNHWRDAPLFCRPVLPVTHRPFRGYNQYKHSTTPDLRHQASSSAQILAQKHYNNIARQTTSNQSQLYHVPLGTPQVNKSSTRTSLVPNSLPSYISSSYSRGKFLRLGGASERIL